MQEYSEGFIDIKGYKTWYSTYGDLKKGVPPLVALHGGPGDPHHHLKNLSKLAQQGIPVVLYDQLGCGKSDRPDNPGLWTIQLFIDELIQLRKTLGLDVVNLLGHSWGGALAIEYVLTKPQGVQNLILSSPLLDSNLWVSEADKLKDKLPKKVATSMRKHEAAGTTDSQEYQDAAKVFNSNFVCRLKPRPKDLIDCTAGSSQQVYQTMWGPSEAYATGILKNWSSLSRLNQITLPTLLLSGKYDEATPLQMELAHTCIFGSRWMLFEKSSHTANYEEEKKYLSTVAEFLIPVPHSKAD